MKIKLILICSVFVVLLILLLPASSAIKIRIVENTVQNEIMEQMDTLDFGELKEKINLEKNPKHPNLFSIVKAVYFSRILRAMILIHLSTEVNEDGWQPYYIVIHPLLYERAMMLGVTTSIWLELWIYISQIFSWDWEF